MTERAPDGSFARAHIKETRLIDSEHLLFDYGDMAVFDVADVDISIRALRGPDSNNRFLSAELLAYETWNNR